MTKSPVLVKICHARVGQRVQLPAENGEVAPEIFVVCAMEEPGKQPGRPGQTHGLYDDQRRLFLVSLATGLTRPMPHLSSRAKLLKGEEAGNQLSGPAPVLVARHEATAARVTTQGPRGKVVTSNVDLAAPEAVYELLKGISDGSFKVCGVQWLTEVAEQELLMEAWRRAVANGQTLMSFAEFCVSPAL